MTVKDWLSLTADILSVLGLFLTALTLRAATGAQEAASQAREGLRLLDNVVDIAGAISLLEEIKRAHRYNQWNILPDRYATVRKLLITLQRTPHQMTQSQREAIAGAVVNLKTMEGKVERALTKKSNTLQAPPFNKALTDHIDTLVDVLMELKKASSGAK